LKRFLRDIHRGHEKEEKDKERAKNEVARLNGLVYGSGGGESSSSGFGRGPTPSTPKPQATPSQRKQQVAQLAELGISIPDEFRGEMAMAGEWQVTSQRILEPEGEGEKKPEAIGFGVRKRAAEEEDEEVVQAKKSKWGSAYRKHPEMNAEDDDLDALLSKATATKPAGGALEVKPEGPSIVKEEVVKLETVDGVQIKPDPEQTPSIKQEPFLDERPLPGETTAAPDFDIKNEGGQPAGGVVFKKRKAKNIRQK
jgi:hypothetical protein